MEFLEANLDDMFNEIRELRETQGALTKEDYFELVDEYLEEKRDWGELHDDTNITAAREALRNKWAEIKEEEA